MKRMVDIYISWLSATPFCKWIMKSVASTSEVSMESKTSGRTLAVLAGRMAGSMCGTTPPCEMMTFPSSLFSLSYHPRQYDHTNNEPSGPVYVLLIVLDSQLQMARYDTRLLVVARRIASKLEDFGSQVLQHSS